MADKSQRTEKPTAKRRKERREEGSVARSVELGGWASLLVTASLLPWLGGLAANRVSTFFQDTTEAMSHPDTGVALRVLGSGLETVAFAALPIVAVGTVVAVAAAVGQVGLHLTPKALRVRFLRVFPRAGLSRLFSTQGLWTLAKTVLKMAVLAAVGYAIVGHLVRGVLGGATLPLPETVSAASSTVVDLVRDIGGLALVIAAADYFFARRTWQQSLRMTKQEVKDERRESDGSPEVRRALRSKARRFSRMQMMAAVTRSDVVVTNPTHFAVAIAYDRATDRAPRVVAKGADFVAAEIRDRARSSGVVIVENPQLARSLHAACEVDDVVPPRLYAAVARLLAFVYSIPPTARVFRDVHTMAG